ncbi:MAG: hypothetical protein JW951_05085, partial [Lentisphaerae bacterium]|nr:hypothetical protein [Lentisphaerota bacterium]
IAAGTGVKPEPADNHPPGKSVRVVFQGPAARRYAQEFSAPFFDGAASRPGCQAYHVAPLPDDGGLVVRGLDVEGVYWGMKTLKQCIRFEGGRVCIPRLRVADGADMEERGIWSQPFGFTSPHDDIEQSLIYYKRWIDWMSDHKLNLFEFIVFGEGGGSDFHCRRHPEFDHPDTEQHEALLRELIPYGRGRGIRMVPILSHPQHYGFIPRAFPELEAPYAMRNHDRIVRLPVNFFHPGARRLLLEVAEELVERFAPDELSCWLTEFRTHALPPDERRGRSQFLQEAQVFYGIVQELRKSSPDLRCKILLTQGSYPENLDLMRALPEEVKWVFYSGERTGTYNTRLRNPIHPDIAAAAAEGRWISLCNPLRGAPAFAAHLGTIERNIGYALDAGLKGLGGMAYAFPGSAEGLFLAAEKTWNRRGRDREAVLRAYAAEQGASNPVTQAEAYRLYDDALIVQSHADTRCTGQPFGNFSRLACLLERIRSNAPVDEFVMRVADEMETDELPAIERAIGDAERALHLAGDAAEPLFRQRCEYLGGILRVTRAATEAFFMNCREKCWDFYKGPWEGHFPEALQARLDTIRCEAEVLDPLYRRIAAMEGWAPRFYEKQSPAAALAALAASIDVHAVTTSATAR